jgi:hypothetical protein
MDAATTAAGNARLGSPGDLLQASRRVREANSADVSVRFLSFFLNPPVLQLRRLAAGVSELAFALRYRVVTVRGMPMPTSSASRVSEIETGGAARAVWNDNEA